MKFHFYKAHCRLGLINIPYGSSERNIGVEDGPDAILTEDFLRSFPGALVDTYTFSNPDTIELTHQQRVIASEYKAFTDLITSTIQKGQIQIVIGGDHSVTFSSYIALSSRVDPKDIAYIQFDSHADIHSFRTSHSDNFHGMYVRAMTGDVESKEVQALVTKSLPASNILYIGNHVNEEEEWDFIRKKNIRIISRPALLEDTDKTIQQIVSFAQAKKHLHISFDIDIFDQTIQPATGILVKDGFFPSDVTPILGALAKHPSISMDLVELNPRKKGVASTVQLAHKLLTTTFKE